MVTVSGEPGGVCFSVAGGFDPAVRIAHVLAQPVLGKKGSVSQACGVKSRGFLTCFPPTAGLYGSVSRPGSAGRLLPWSYPGWSRRAGNRPRLIAGARFFGVRRAKTWVVESGSRVLCDRCPGSCRGARLPARSRAIPTAGTTGSVGPTGNHPAVCRGIESRGDPAFRIRPFVVRETFAVLESVGADLCG